MKTTVATGIYITRKPHNVVVSNIHKDISQKGTPMYVLNCDIILEESEDEDNARTEPTDFD